MQSSEDNNFFVIKTTAYRINIFALIFFLKSQKQFENQKWKEGIKP